MSVKLGMDGLPPFSSVYPRDSLLKLLGATPGSSVKCGIIMIAVTSMISTRGSAPVRKASVGGGTAQSVFVGQNDHFYHRQDFKEAS